MSEQNEQVLTIGARLRSLTSAAKINQEIARFVDVLTENANKGFDHVSFPDLREYLNTMIMAGTIWDWMSKQELTATGGVDQNTGAYNYVISW